MASLSPVFNGVQFFDNNGAVLTGGKLFTYQGGSTTVFYPTFTDSSGSTPWTQPIVLDSSGRLPGALWLDPNQTYNLVIYAADGVTPLQGIDGVTGVPTAATANASSTVWTVGPAPSFAASNQFTLVGSFVAEFAPGNRVKLESTGGTFQYATVSAVAFNAGVTTVTVINDAGPITGLLVRVFISLNDAPGFTVDAGAVAFKQTFGYSNAATVGGQLMQAQVAITSLNSRAGNANVLWRTTGSGGTHVLTPTPAALTVTSDAVYTVQFATASIGSATFNISGLGAYPLVQFDSTGGAVNAVITANLISQVVFDAQSLRYFLINPLPAAVPVATSYTLVDPFGALNSRSVFLSGGTWRLSLTTSGSDSDSFGNSNITVLQSVQVLTVGTVSTSMTLQRSGSSGHDRKVYGLNTNSGLLYSVAPGFYTFQLNAISISGTTTGNYAHQGSWAILEKVS